MHFFVDIEQLQRLQSLMSTNSKLPRSSKLFANYKSALLEYLSEILAQDTTSCTEQ